jgi:hypothetical protein
MPNVDMHSLDVRITADIRYNQCHEKGVTERKKCVINMNALGKGVLPQLTSDPGLLESTKRHPRVKLVDAVHLQDNSALDGDVEVASAHTHAVPAFSLCAVRIARLRSLEKMAAARPYIVSFACLMTSSHAQLQLSHQVINWVTEFAHLPHYQI